MITLLVSLPILFATPSDESDPKLRAAQTLAQSTVDATVKGDLERVVDLTHPKVVAAAGGRQKILNRLIQARKSLEKDEISYVSGKAGLATTLYEAKSGLYCVVPVAYRVKSGDSRLILKSPLIGVSTDAGKTWKFLDTSPGEAKVRKLVPEIPKELEFPPDEEPQADPDKSAA